MSEEKKVSLLEVEVNKISLKPGDVLLAKVRGQDFRDDAVCEALKDALKSVFPNNKIGVLFLEENQIDLTVISQETANLLQAESEKQANSENKACNNQNTCANCDCGKKTETQELPKEE